MRLRRGAVVGLALLLAVSACSGRDTSTPVPTGAAAPFVCDGVPGRAAELILGGDVAAKRRYGQWGLKDGGFQCDVVRAGTNNGVVMVEEWDVGTLLGVSPEDALRQFATEAAAEPVSASTRGAGYVIGTAKSGSAKWVCGERVLVVDLVSVGNEGRDQRADAQALLVSMLPWACGGEKPPAQTVGK